MHSIRHLSLLCSFLALSCASQVLDLPFSLTDNYAEDIFSLDGSSDEILPWEESFDDTSDPPLLFASGCSDFVSLIGRKRARRGDSPGFCNAPHSSTDSTAEDGQIGGNGLSGESQDSGIDPSVHSEDQLSIPSLATYDHQKHDDCVRLSNGKLPLAVCDVGPSGASPDYFIDGRPYWDLIYSYPSKEMLRYPSPPPFLSLPAPFLVLGLTVWMRSAPIPNTHMLHYPSTLQSHRLRL